MEGVGRVISERGVAGGASAVVRAVSALISRLSGACSQPPRREAEADDKKIGLA